MSNPSYIATNQDELFEKSSKEIQDLILGDELNSATAVLGKIYKIPISSYIALENIISFLLIGALQPENAVQAIKDLLDLPEEEAYKLAGDLDKSILEKARIKILGKPPTDMVTLTFQEGRSPNELRKEILDTTKRELPVLPSVKDPVVPPEKGSVPTSEPIVPPKEEASAPKKSISVAGSRSLLMEQLQMLDTIPDDNEVTERLSKIQEQIAAIDKQKSATEQPAIPLQNFMFGEKGGETAEPESKPASYSKAPTKYNVDPYREMAGEE